jgi:chromate transporter
MTGPSDTLTLTTRLALLSSISFGAFPTVLPDVHEFVVATHGWLSDQEFSNLFALSQAIPGPNMILMMSFIGWQVWGLPGAITSAFATFGPPCTLYFASYRFWDRFCDARWQPVVRAGLVPLTIGLVVCERGRDGERVFYWFGRVVGHPDSFCAGAEHPIQPVMDDARRRRARCARFVVKSMPYGRSEPARPGSPIAHFISRCPCRF